MSRTLLLLFWLILIGPMAVLADGQDSAEVSVQPWNGFWWPHMDGGMATGSARMSSFPEPRYWDDWLRFFAPFDKYPMAFQEEPRGDLWQWEYEHHYHPDGPSWWGHCNGWAAASVSEAEPVVPGELNGIYFRVGDKKAFLTEMHQADGFLILFDEEDDGADIFHQTLVQYIKDLDKPLLAEVDSGEEVWNFPCFKYEMTWTDEGNVRHVSATLYFGIDNVSPDHVGNASSNASYTYDLTMSGEEIVSGIWTGGSVETHPQYLWDVLVQNQANPYLDSERVTQIVASTVDSVRKNGLDDDYLEENDTPAAAVPLPGEIFLGRLLDDDCYQIPVEAGEDVDVAFYNEKIDGASECVLRRGSGEEIEDREIETDRIVMQAGVQEEDDTLVLEISALAPQTNHRNYGVEVIRDVTSCYMPHVVNADGWNTRMFMLNPGQQQTDLYYHFYRTEDGLVEKLYYEPTFSFLESGQFVAGFLDTFFQDLDPDNQRWLKVNCSDDLEGVFVFEHEDWGGNLASMPFLKEGSRTLYFNHLAVDDIWWTGVSIANTDPYRPAQVTLQPYTPDGGALPEILSITIAGGGRYINMLGAAFSAETLAQTGWIRVTADRDIVGFELFGTNDLTLFEGIPLQHATSKNLTAPWIPPDSGTWAGISIVNPNTGSTTAIITPRNATGINAYGLIDPQTAQVDLPPDGKFVILVDQLFPDPTFGPVAYLTISSYRPVTGFILYGDGDGVLCGYPLAEETDVRNAGVFPWLDGSTLLVNKFYADIRERVLLDAYDEGGNLLASGESGELSIRTVHRLDPVEIWGGEVPAGIAYFRWSGTQDLLILDEVKQGTRATVLPSMDTLE